MALLSSTTLNLGTAATGDIGVEVQAYSADILAKDANGNLDLTGEIRPRAALGKVVALTAGTETLDCSLGNAFTMTLNADTTITLDFSNVDLDTNSEWTGILTMTASGTRTLAFAGGTTRRTPGAVAIAPPPDGETNIYMITTSDGATFDLLTIGEDMS